MENARELPWRNIRDPYKIWLSEIILQQTRVKQGLPYYLNFLKKFPTLVSLASASESDVLRQWQGLGYYSRARNIHKCAKFVHRNLKGKFPDSYYGLIKLPGIGPYTAAAIASFAFGQPVAAIDGNALRVYSRLFGIFDDISKTSTVKTIRDEADKIISKDIPDLYNQAIMELGATICQPLNQACDICPLSPVCYASIHGEQNNLPIKNNKITVRNRYFNYFLLRQNEGIAMFERKQNDIWKGLYDFYLIESETLMEPDEISDPFISDALLFGSTIDILSTKIKYVLSHQIIFARLFEVRVPDNILKEELPESPSLNFYSKKEILDLPKPVLVNNFLNHYFTREEKDERGKNY